MTIPELTELIKQSYEFIILIGAAGGGVGVTWFSSKVSSRISEMDKKQNEKLDKLEKLVDRLVANENQHLKAHIFKDKLNIRIQGTIDSFIATEPNMDNAITSMFIEGGNHAYEFFLYIYKIGYKNVKMNAINRRSITVFRALRSGYGNNNNVPPEIADKIKKEVAYPMIKELEMEYRKFVSENYNGSTDEEFLKIADWFVSEIIKRSVKYFN